MYEELVFQFNHKLFLTLNDTLKPSKPNCMIAIIEYKMCIEPPAIVRTCVAQVTLNGTSRPIFITMKATQFLNGTP